MLRLQHLGHKHKDIDDVYAHVTPAMRERMLPVRSPHTQTARR
ncbi:hypothetical protein [Pseudonocardia sp. DLS-67]